MQSANHAAALDRTIREGDAAATLRSLSHSHMFPKYWDRA